MFLTLSPFDVVFQRSVTSQYQQKPHFSLCKKKQAVYSLSGLIFINTTEALFHSLVERITTLPSDRLYSHWYLFFPLLLNINKTSNSTVLHDTATVYTLVLQRCSSQTSQARWRTSFLDVIMHSFHSYWSHLVKYSMQ